MEFGVGFGTVARIKAEMGREDMLSAVSCSEDPSMPLPVPNFATVDELKRAALLAARSVMREHSEASAETWELAITGRFAIHLSRQPIILRLEEEGILTESQYPNMGFAKDPKTVRLAPDRPLEQIRPDIIVHKRGPDGPNCLAIELKPLNRDSPRPPAMDERDAKKLEALTCLGEGFEYALGLWFVLPRGAGHLGYYAEFREGQCRRGPVCFC